MESDFQIAQFSVYIICSILSFNAALIVIYIITSRKLHKIYSFKILFFISINDTVRSFIGFAFYPFISYSDLFCISYAYITSSVIISDMVWATCISVSIHKTIVLPSEDYSKYYKYWLFSATGGSLLIEAIPILTNSYRFRENTCEIVRDFWGNVWRFSLLYFPLTAMLGVNFFLIWEVHRKIQKMENVTLRFIAFNMGFVYALLIGFMEILFFIFRIIQNMHAFPVYKYIDFGLYTLLILHGVFDSILFFRSDMVRQCLSDEKNKGTLLSLKSESRPVNSFQSDDF